MRFTFPERVLLPGEFWIAGGSESKRFQGSDLDGVPRGSGDRVGCEDIKTEGASARSRQVLKSARTDVRANLFGYALQASVFSKVPIDLAVPSGVVPLANESSQFREFFGRKGIHCALDFCETHGARLTEIMRRNDDGAFEISWA